MVMYCFTVSHHRSIGPFHAGTVHTGLFIKDSDCAQIHWPGTAVTRIHFFVPLSSVVTPPLLIERLCLILGKLIPPFESLLGKEWI